MAGPAAEDDVREIADGVFAIRTEMETPADPWMYVYLVRGERHALIDTGVAGAPTRFVQPALRRLGLATGDVDVVLNTHGHMDHVGGNAELRDWGAQLYAHRLDRRRLESADYHIEHAAFGLAAWDRLDLLEARERRLRILLGDVVGVDGFLEDDDVIDLGGVQIGVRHLPGHTPGAVCFELIGTGIYLTGDTVQGLCTQHPGEMPIVEEPGFYRTSMNWLRERRPDVLLMAHPFRGVHDELGPFADDGKADQILSDSLRVDAVLREAALTVLAESPTVARSRQAARMVELVTAELGLRAAPNGLPVNSVVSVPSYLAWAAGEATRPW